MKRRERDLSLTGEVVKGRPDWKNTSFGVTRASRVPKYIHGQLRLSSLLHKVDYVDIHWYTPIDGGANLGRLVNPWMTAKTICGHSFFIGMADVTTCELPRPDVVFCGRCSGTGPVFRRDKPSSVTRLEARDRLGCIALGHSR